jgi:hypothetical protein
VRDGALSREADVEDAIKKIILTIPKAERGRVMTMVISDLLENIQSGRNGEAIDDLEAIASNLYLTENSDRWDNNPPAAVNEGYEKLARKIEEIYGADFNRVVAFLQKGK